jgi:hypothetical protein
MQVRSRSSSSLVLFALALIAFSVRATAATGVRLELDATVSADPKFGVTYRAAYAVEVEENGVLVRRFTIHVPDSTALPEAQRAGRFLGQLWRAANRRLGTLASGLRRTTVDVWMTRTGDAGGEQFRTNLYIYDITSERTGIEWARELAHEYGHYLLPGATNYTSPESWSNGILGERLLLRWLRDDLTSGALAADELPYVRAAELDDFCAKQVTPLIDRIKNNGSDPAALERQDRKGMDAFTSVMLFADEVYGPRSLFDMLDYLPAGRAASARGADFLAAFTGYVSNRDSGTLHADPGRAMRVYLPAGTLLLNADKGSRVSIKPAARSTATTPGPTVTVRSAAAAWHTLVVTGPLPDVTWKRAGQ